MTNLVLSPAIAALPWQPVSPGFSLKLVRGSSSNDDTRVLLLRVEPGTVIARHRHSGEVHALNLAGTRELLDTGEIVGPGGYVYEPSGNVDSWRAVGDEPAIVFLTARGTIEYLDERGEAISRSTTASVSERYRAFITTGAVRGA
ncbi:MAG TPA: cupin domain-containing protein [Kofleriaceae bacterium]|nr:cupin domain-containing protein [Kofleriaceae bacterium]